MCGETQTIAKYFPVRIGVNSRRLWWYSIGDVEDVLDNFFIEHVKCTPPYDDVNIGPTHFSFGYEEKA
jgi:hypothetical protein